MYRKALLALPVLLLAAVPVFADEPDEERRGQKIERKRAIVVREGRGRGEEGEHAERRDPMESLKRRFIEMQRRGASEEELADLKREMLRFRGDREEREREERERHERSERQQHHAEHDDHDHEHHAEHGERHEHHENHAPGPRHEFAERMERLQIAADNLLQAGMRDLADEVMNRAEGLEREHHRSERGPEPGPRMMEEMQQQMHHLRRQMEELQQHVRNLERVIRHHHDEDEDDDDDDDDD